MTWSYVRIALIIYSSGNEILQEVSDAKYVGIQIDNSFACYIPNVKSFGIKSFFFTGSKHWNSLSHSIQCITDKFIFKKMIKGTLWNRLQSAHISEYIFYWY